jgi:hypothetical protein
MQDSSLLPGTFGSEEAAPIARGCLQLIIAAHPIAKTSEGNKALVRICRGAADLFWSNG